MGDNSLQRRLSLLKLAAVAITVAGPLLSHGWATAQETAPGRLLVDPAELRSLFAKNTLTGPTLGGDSWAEYYCANGIAIYSDKGAIKVGRWRIEGQKTCFAYDAPSYVKEHCASTYRRDDGGLILRFDQSSSFKDIAIAEPPLPGDPLGLQSKAKNNCDKRPAA
ncbi:hypothetical protein [Dongia sp. agr-C8]